MRVLRAVAFLYLLVIVAVFAQSYQGRKGVVSTQREGCMRQARRSVDTINRDAATVRKDDTLIGDSRLSAAESAAIVEEGARAAEEAQTLLGQLDPSQIPRLVDRDYRVLAARSHFTCARAYPSAKPWPVLLDGT